ncbi:MAG: Hsp20/alpha crystallin family protein [Alphaproteobacteria bacterium]|nr:Hsp20/alpha crystallin family protein [Alphaproteobacteria bacterium]
MSDSAADVALAQLKKLLARDPMLRDLLSGAIPGMPRGTGYSPEVDVLEVEGKHVVLVDLPGVRRDAVRVRLEGARLVIEGERPDTRPVGTLRTGERPHGRFAREFLLPADVDAEGVRAALDDGVLRVEVPRLGRGVDRVVPVEAGTVSATVASENTPGSR